MPRGFASGGRSAVSDSAYPVGWPTGWPIPASAAGPWPPGIDENTTFNTACCTGLPASVIVSPPSCAPVMSDHVDLSCSGGPDCVCCDAIDIGDCREDDSGASGCCGAGGTPYYLITSTSCTPTPPSDTACIINGVFECCQPAP